MPQTALIVEDEKAISGLLVQILRRRGIDAHVAHEGKAGLEWARAHLPDLLLLDLMLPDMDGYAVCRQLKLDRGTNQIPIVMVTGLAQPQDRVRGLEVGANEYVTKPFTNEQLSEAIERALAWREKLVQSGTQGEVHFEMRSDMKLLGELNQLLSSMLLHTGLSEQDALRLTMAVREMGTNGMEWGHRKQLDLLLTVTYRIDASKVEIVVTDTGPGFDRNNLPHAADPEDPARHMVLRDALGLRPGGFGILMSRGLVDEMSYNLKGNEVRLVKYLTPPAADQSS
jgi:DNA-binding response OmpR family regulator